jgi:hypothetical protein
MFLLSFRYLRKLRAATTFAYNGGDQQADSILNKRELVPNTNRHALEGSNPVWMTGVGYDNFDYRKEDVIPTNGKIRPTALHGGGDGDEIVERRNNVNGVRRALGNMDSLDANVLNDSCDEDDEDCGYDDRDARCTKKSICC